MITNLHPEVIKFFKEQGTVLDSGFNDEMYLYYPFWLKTLPDGKVEIIDWDKVPDNLKELITDKRESGIVNFRNGAFVTKDSSLAEALESHPRNKTNIKPDNHE